MSIILPNPPLAIDAGPGDTPEYPAAAFRSAVSALLAKTPGSAGVARTGALDPRSFAISVSGGNVHAAAGGYVIGSSAGAYLCALDDQAQIGALEPADPTNDRRDAIVLRIDDPDNGGRGDRNGSLEIVTGIPSPIPQVPVPVGTSVYDQLATVSVPRAGSGQPAVTDTRTHTGASGGVITVGREQDLDQVSTQAGALAYVTQTRTLHYRDQSVWRTMEAVDDTGWSIVSPASGFRHYSSGNPVKVRRVGNVVHLVGAYGTDLQDLNAARMATLPAQFRPTETGVRAIMQGSGLNRWMLNVQLSGAVMIDRYGPGNPSSSNTWLPFSLTWLV